MSLYVKAKAITQFLRGERPLPDYLQHFVPLLKLLLFGGTPLATGVGLYYAVQRHRKNRANIQLAIFHVLRTIENRPDLQALLQQPHKLIAEMESEVVELIDRNLRKKDCPEVMRSLKRKVWKQEIGRPVQRRRLSNDKSSREVLRHEPSYANIEGEENRDQEVDQDQIDIHAQIENDIRLLRILEEKQSDLKLQDSRRTKSPSLYLFGNTKKPDGESRASYRFIDPKISNKTSPPRSYGFSYDEWSSDSSDEKAPNEQLFSSITHAPLTTEPAPVSTLDQARQQVASDTRNTSCPLKTTLASTAHPPTPLSVVAIKRTYSRSRADQPSVPEVGSTLSSITGNIQYYVSGATPSKRQKLQDTRHSGLVNFEDVEKTLRQNQIETNERAAELIGPQKSVHPFIKPRSALQALKVPNAVPIVEVDIGDVVEIVAVATQQREEGDRPSKQSMSTNTGRQEGVPVLRRSTRATRFQGHFGK